MNWVGLRPFGRFGLGLFLILARGASLAPARTCVNNCTGTLFLQVNYNALKFTTD